ncbi:MAG: hypothetical protein ACRC8Y_12860 [Chroococcales cyanobacterium]
MQSLSHSCRLPGQAESSMGFLWMLSRCVVSISSPGGDRIY